MLPTSPVLCCRKTPKMTLGNFAALIRVFLLTVRYIRSTHKISGLEIVRKSFDYLLVFGLSADPFTPSTVIKTTSCSLLVFVRIPNQRPLSLSLAGEDQAGCFCQSLWRCAPQPLHRPSPHRAGYQLSRPLQQRPTFSTIPNSPPSDQNRQTATQQCGTTLQS